MNELDGVVKTTEKDRRKYIKQLQEIKADPVSVVKKAKRLRNIMFVLGVLVMLGIQLFHTQITGLIRDIMVAAFAVLVSIAAFHGMLIKNIPLGLEFIDWEKVARAQYSESPPPLPPSMEH